MIEFDRVTTRGGDTGMSGLFSGERRRKDDLLFETLGDGDELSSFLGVARVYAETAAIAEALHAQQQVLHRVLAMVATAPTAGLYTQLSLVTEREVEELERREAAIMKTTRIGEDFIVPGESKSSAHIDVSRSVCRRFERRIVSCIRDRGLAHLIPCQQYVNRLSDFLFVLARHAEQL